MRENTTVSLVRTFLAIVAVVILLLVLPLLAAIIDVLSFFAPAIGILILCLGGYWITKRVLTGKRNS